MGGTQTNLTVIAAALRPHQGALGPEGAHINVHETGAVENCGHKIQALPAVNGKISAAQIKEAAELYETSGVQEHITQPKLVYLSHPTEYGTIYSLRELEDIHAVCQAHGLYLFVDGARMGYGLAADGTDVTLADLARLTDAFYIGGTKCGMLFGEAVVITNPSLKVDFRSYIKQNGAMLAKGWLLGLQFYTLFKDGLYFDITAKAVNYAMEIKKAFAEKGIPAFIESPTNQQFVVVTEEQMSKLGERYIFEYEGKIDETHHCVRFCTSWSTQPEEVEALIADICSL